MEFEPRLIRGRLVARYKRFFVDVRLDDGRLVTAHCTNTGSLRGCLREDARVLIQPESNPNRKLKWTFKMVRVGRTWVGLDTALAVPLVEEALGRGLLPELEGYARALREVPYGVEGRSRIDLLLSRGGRQTDRKGRRFEGDERVYVEVKNTTFAIEERSGRFGAFPDAVTVRGQKHLVELMDVVSRGHRAAMVYVLQRSDCEKFTVADAIDPEYGAMLRRAVEAGVETYALAGPAGSTRVRLDRCLTIVL